MIVVRRLRFTYPDGTPALRGVDLRIDDGEFVLICGSNGSGKTTLIRHLNGLLRPGAGTVSVDGLSTVRHAHRIRRRVAMIFQDSDTQILGETVAEDIAFGPENLGLSQAQVEHRVQEAALVMGIHQVLDRPCHLLSGGQKRRLAIAGALAMRPHTLVLDEPFSNLDYEGVRETLRQLVALHRQGKTIIVTTHDVDKVIARATRVIILDRGRVGADGSPEALLPRLSRFGIRPPCYYLLGGEPLSWLNE